MSRRSRQSCYALLTNELPRFRALPKGKPSVPGVGHLGTAGPPHRGSVPVYLGHRGGSPVQARIPSPNWLRIHTGQKVSNGLTVRWVLYVWNLRVWCFKTVFRSSPGANRAVRRCKVGQSGQLYSLSISVAPSVFEPLLGSRTVPREKRGNGKRKPELRHSQPANPHTRKTIKARSAQFASCSANEGPIFQHCSTHLVIRIRLGPG